MIGHSAPDDRGQHLDIKSGRALWNRVLPVTPEHCSRDGHDVLKGDEMIRLLSGCSDSEIIPKRFGFILVLDLELAELHLQQVLTGW